MALRRQQSVGTGKRPAKRDRCARIESAVEPALARDDARKKTKGQPAADAERHAADQGENRIVGLEFGRDHCNHRALILTALAQIEWRANRSWVAFPAFGLLSFLFVINSNPKAKSPK